ncbi:MAG: HAMP domain-containing histidine kinase [Lachnospiraceae bacterium]|nr:HAMP domain-containing histidine kinase [Lachnospiraceae bacterium]
MDTIKKILWKYKWKNLTLRKALALYIFVGFITAILCSSVFIIFFENWKDIVFQVNGVQGVEMLLHKGNYQVISAEEDSSLEKVTRQIEILKFMEIVSVLICSGGAIVCVSHQYYKRKLEEPLRILKKEMEFIGRDDLSFDCSYVSNDEMGQICQTFNRMRKQLIKNQENLWELMESQRELNAAFAHDIRTPLTVMKGYIQMLLQFYPTGKLSEDKLVETLLMLQKQTERMEQFSLTMKEIHVMEEWRVNRQPLLMKELIQQIDVTLQGLPKEGKEIYLHVDTHKDKDELICDKNLIQEVVDNLLINALRYAKKEVNVFIQREEEGLYIYVKDDGDGFTKEALMKAARPYFSTTEGHFGLGLTICQTLCKKHGGELEVLNSIEGGGIGSVYFMTI